jgi:hypothetical protein
MGANNAENNRKPHPPTGKFGGEKPHMSFWLDKDNDIRIAIWLNSKGETAYYQITEKNMQISDTSPIINNKGNEVELKISNNQPTIKVEEDDDLPF